MRGFVLGAAGVIAFCATARADQVSASGSNSLSNYFAKHDKSASNSQIDVATMRHRFQVQGEVFIMDPSGERLLATDSETRLWEQGRSEQPMEVRWGEDWSPAGQLYLRQLWTINDDGSLTVRLEQYAHMVYPPGEERQFADLLKSDELQVKDFAPVIWPSAAPAPDGNRVIVRLTPRLGQGWAAVDLGTFPIVGTEASVSDNQGHLWADHTTFKGPYVALKTNQGSLFMSYAPFPGGREVGSADGQRLHFNLDDGRTVILHSDTPFLPPGVEAKVYGLFKPELRTGRPGSKHLWISSDEAHFLMRMQDD